MATAKSAASYYSAAAGRKCGLRKRCMGIAKQQKTRFYILGRCVSMLLCWHAHSLSD